MRKIAITDGCLTMQPHEHGLIRGSEALFRRAGELAGVGVERVLLREKTLPLPALLYVAAGLAEALNGTGCRLSVAGPHALAATRATHAQGVHLGRTPRLRAEVADALGAGLEVSLSCHSLPEIAQARALGATAVLFAPVFGKWVAGELVVPGAGLAALTAACLAAAPMPVYALGGVDDSNAADCVAAGAAGVAGIRLAGW